MPHSVYNRVSAECKDLLTLLLHKDPVNRIGFNGTFEIRNHPWFENINWEAVSKKRISPPYKPVLEIPNDLRHFS